jgi:hypothetical protein
MGGTRGSHVQGLVRHACVAKRSSAHRSENSRIVKAEQVAENHYHTEVSAPHLTRETRKWSADCGIHTRSSRQAHHLYRSVASHEMGRSWRASRSASAGESELARPPFCDGGMPPRREGATLGHGGERHPAQGNGQREREARQAFRRVNPAVLKVKARFAVLGASLENSRSRAGGDAHIERHASIFIPSAAAQRHLGVFGMWMVDARGRESARSHRARGGLILGPASTDDAVTAQSCS